jgi:ribosomal protein L40E
VPGWVIIVIAVVIVLLVVLAINRAFLVARYARESTKVCPDCRSRIPADARVCRHCQYRFDQVP